MSERDEFYIGYLDRAPGGVGGFVRMRVVLIAIIGVLIAAVLASSQNPFTVAFFDFGSPRTYEGVVRTSPHPVLEVDRPGAADGSVSRYMLVGFGKAGAEGDVGELDGQRIRLEATPIYRDAQTMLEIVPESVEALGAGPGPAAAALSLGEFTLEGEIVDSKCHLGVMKPGETKPHRACATLCIRGGIPPILVLRSGDLPVAHLMLVGADGEAINEHVLDYVAEPVRIRGEVMRMGDLWMLRAAPTAIRRLP
ncbi:MAG: hypothetical protein AAGM22_11055 [Acidobacteriota bacterium]